MRGQENASKLYVLKCAAYNLGLLLRKVWGMIKPRGLVGAGAAALCLLWVVLAVLEWLSTPAAVLGVALTVGAHAFERRVRTRRGESKKVICLTGC